MIQPKRFCAMANRIDDMQHAIRSSRVYRRHQCTMLVYLDELLERLRRWAIDQRQWRIDWLT